jgi:hypothetical protein
VCVGSDPGFPLSICRYVLNGGSPKSVHYSNRMAAGKECVLIPLAGAGSCFQIDLKSSSISLGNRSNTFKN